MWFLYEWMYLTVDSLYDIAEKRKKIKLDMLALQVALNGRSIEEPLEMDNTNKLILKNFSKKYKNKDHYAVKNANLEINGGEIFGFLGPNGAGKSTIIKSIVGIQPITDGSINVCGYDVDKQSVQAKKLIGFVPDHYALYEKLTGREYINYIADLYGVSKEDRDNRIKKYVKLFELEIAFDNQMRTYSHGMKQKIAIMSALVHNPKVWILDEPLTGLDPNSIYQVKECMKEHAKMGNIVFFSSHIIDVVERICDRIAIIKKGEIGESPLSPKSPSLTSTTIFSATTYVLKWVNEAVTLRVFAYTVVLSSSILPSSET
jgi:ABC-2 type transport system ATP-binding protein